MTTTTTATDTMTIGTRLVELCREGENMQAIETLYGDDVVSIEAMSCSEFDQTVNGLDAVKAKNKSWSEANEVHGAEVNGPFPHGDRFIVEFKYEVTPKEGPMAGNRMTMHEMGHFTVENGKITKEEFYYDMSGC